MYKRSLKRPTIFIILLMICNGYLFLINVTKSKWLFNSFFFLNDKVQEVYLATTKTFIRVDFNNFVFYISFYLLKNLLFLIDTLTFFVIIIRKMQLGVWCVCIYIYIYIFLRLYRNWRSQWWHANMPWSWYINTCHGVVIHMHLCDIYIFYYYYLTFAYGN